jgi:hypothetical protein
VSNGIVGVKEELKKKKKVSGVEERWMVVCVIYFLFLRYRKRDRYLGFRHPPPAPELTINSTTVTRQPFILTHEALQFRLFELSRFVV